MFFDKSGLVWFPPQRLRGVVSGVASFGARPWFRGMHPPSLETVTMSDKKKAVRLGHRSRAIAIGLAFREGVRTMERALHYLRVRKPELTETDGELIAKLSETLGKLRLGPEELADAQFKALREIKAQLPSGFVFPRFEGEVETSAATGKPAELNVFAGCVRDGIAALEKEKAEAAAAEAAAAAVSGEPAPVPAKNGKGK